MPRAFFVFHGAANVAAPLYRHPQEVFCRLANNK